MRIKLRLCWQKAASADRPLQQQLGSGPSRTPSCLFPVVPFKRPPNWKRKPSTRRVFSILRQTSFFLVSSSPRRHKATAHFSDPMPGPGWPRSVHGRRRRRSCARSGRRRDAHLEGPAERPQPTRLPKGKEQTNKPNNLPPWARKIPPTNPTSRHGREQLKNQAAMGRKQHQEPAAIRRRSRHHQPNQPLGESSACA